MKHLFILKINNFNIDGMNISTNKEKGIINISYRIDDYFPSLLESVKKLYVKTSSAVDEKDVLHLQRQQFDRLEQKDQMDYFICALKEEIKLCDARIAWLTERIDNPEGPENPIE